MSPNQHSIDAKPGSDCLAGADAIGERKASRELFSRGLLGRSPMTDTTRRSLHRAYISLSASLLRYCYGTCMTAQIDDQPPQEWFSVATDLLKALAVESRLRILWALLHGEHSVNDLADHVGASPSAVSQHLRQLRRLDLVTTRRQGNFIFYSCDHAHVQALVAEALSHAYHVTGGQLAIDGGMAGKESA